jgi:hypothetical protein
LVTTPELIDMLCASATPVRRLRAPLVRAGLWLLLAGLVLLALVAVHGARPDLALHLRDPSFATALAGSLLTGILAAVAAFHLSLPDRSRLWLLLPAPALALWVATIGYGCLTNWVALAPEGVRLGGTLECFATLLIASLPLSVALIVMLRDTSLFDPTIVGIMAGLATAGIAATAMSLVHEIDATVMVLIWNLGAAALIVALSGAFGRKIFSGTSPLRLDVASERR